MAHVLLIHGASSNAGYWRCVTGPLEAAGHTVKAADLPTSDPSADFDVYAQSALSQIEPDRPVTVIGQSMGAFTAAVVAARADTESVLLVAPMIPAPGETPGQWGANVGLLDAQQAAARAGGYDPEFDLMTTFMHDVPGELVEQLMAEGEPPQSPEIFAAPLPLSGWPNVRTRVLACRQDRMFPLPLVQRLARERVSAEVDVMDGGHLPAFAHPRELVERILSHLNG